MQTVVNCVLRQNHQILMLNKPRRGWWVAPGGKVELGESLREAVVREFEEETGLLLNSPELRGVFSIVLSDRQEVLDHWMLFTFYAESYSGTLAETSDEGRLEWIGIDSLDLRPMAEGDRYFLKHVIQQPALLTGKFIYTPDYELMEWKPEGTLPILS